MRTLIIGSGPAAAGVALALQDRGDGPVTVLDVGERLEHDHQASLRRLASQPHEEWSGEDLALVTAQPEPLTRGALPQKRSYGSAFPFRDAGQLNGVHAVDGANDFVVSAAYGGFSNVWGAQVMPFSAASFDTWPLRLQDLQPHYRAVLDELPFAGESDSLAELFPLLAPAQSLPPLAARTRRVLERYEQAPAAVQRHGVTVGRARLAFGAGRCIGCGHCMTGCPYSLIWSAAQTFDRLCARGTVRHHDGLLVERVAEEPGVVVADARELRTGRRVRFEADRIFVACGALGTTRLVLGSMRTAPAHLELQESVQFVLPMLSRVPVADPRTEAARTFTLNQFNVLVDLDGRGYDLSQVHCYPYNPAVLTALPRLFGHPLAAGLTSQLLRRMTVGLGYLPSWASPKVRVTHRPSLHGCLPDMKVGPASSERPAMLRQVLRRLLMAAPHLDLWPVLTQVRMSGAAKSYHVGGSFPHGGEGPAVTDLLGRLPEWSRIHLVDGAVLPSVPSTTFTLTVMANAHRIASAVAAGE